MEETSLLALQIYLSLTQVNFHLLSKEVIKPPTQCSYNIGAYCPMFLSSAY